eukprot:6200526-Pleurochrysis_carterae.AAC.4
MWYEIRPVSAPEALKSSICLLLERRFPGSHFGRFASSLLGLVFSLAFASTPADFCIQDEFQEDRTIERDVGDTQHEASSLGTHDGRICSTQHDASRAKDESVCARDASNDVAPQSEGI